MKTLLFIAISLVSGIIAGEILAAINLFVVEPSTDKAISFETQKDIAKGEKVDFGELSSYRIWQKSGTFAAGAFIGMAYGGLLGIAYVFFRKYLTFSDDRKKALLLAGLIYLALYLVPFSKYPPNPPAVGNPDTISLRQHLYTTYQITSVLVAVAMGVIFFKFRRVNKISYIVPAIYLISIATMYVTWPPNPDKIEIQMSVVNTFRAVSGTTMAIFFGLIGLFFGLLWNKYKPDQTSRIHTMQY
ncbi:MAG TPA: CbtA family protein [Nitrososphaeraceae archaeon]|jgi:predicted cobalt transporter CbtA